MTIEAGTKLGRYEVRSKIGEGGMGEVYLPRDTKRDRTAALKILHSNSRESRSDGMLHLRSQVRAVGAEQRLARA